VIIVSFHDKIVRGVVANVTCPAADMGPNELPYRVSTTLPLVKAVAGKNEVNLGAE